ncbi:uncharacterized protein LOC129599019 [Paramacrobiotus metropolitanus]|uniref:uncharacterized protein LOC129599019 n=1 Tax=Paramacrobiotus metropolitanus TaxID=2943436 RepID=UPI0024464603|nr:uncharacterized protein LOC129599019 [Paramacrobiotus metropolitanus]
MGSLAEMHVSVDYQTTNLYWKDDTSQGWFAGCLRYDKNGNSTIVGCHPVLEPAIVGHLEKAFAADMTARRPLVPVATPAVAAVAPQDPASDQFRVDPAVYDPFDPQQLGEFAKKETGGQPMEAAAADEWLDENDAERGWVPTASSSLSSLPTTAPCSPLSSPMNSAEKSSASVDFAVKAHIISNVDRNKQYIIDLKPELLKTMKEAGKNKSAFELTDYQKGILSVILQDQPVLTQGPAKSGKTAAYILAILHQLKFEHTRPVCQCIIVAETFEKIDQIANMLITLGGSEPVRVLAEQPVGKKFYTAAFGRDQSSPPHILVGRPVKLRDLILSIKLDTKSVRMMVFDEVSSVGVDPGVIFAVPKVEPSLLEKLVKCEFDPNEVETLPETLITAGFNEMVFNRPPVF